MQRFILAVISGIVLAAAADAPLLEPKQLADSLGAAGARPEIIQVGFNVLYRSKHIPGAIYAGPASKPDGLVALKAAAGKLPRGRELVIYCGCCPWDRCPNIKPAMELLKQMGFTNVKALHVPDNFRKDWVDRGYPVE